jgi:hypothetical protein
MSDLGGLDLAQHGAALGVIGLLIKALVDSLRNRNGRGPVTKEDFHEGIADLKDEMLRVRNNQHDLRDRLGTLIGTQELHDYRITRLENPP